MGKPCSSGCAAEPSSAGDVDWLLLKRVRLCEAGGGPSAAAADCVSASIEFERLSGEAPARLSAEILTTKEMTDLRRDLADSLMQRQEAAGLTRWAEAHWARPSRSNTEFRVG
jgi:hypothetical protein